MPHLLIAIAILSHPQSNDHDLDRRWLGKIFNPDRVSTVIAGKATRVALHEEGFTVGERPGQRLIKSKRPSANWERRFRQALLNVRNHQWNVRCAVRGKVDVSVRFESGTQKCDVGFRLSTGEVMFWSDLEGHSVSQSIRPGFDTYLNLLGEIFPELKSKYASHALPPLSEKVFGPPDEAEKIRLRRAGVWGKLGEEWQQVLEAPSTLTVWRYFGEPRSRSSTSITPPITWIKQFSQAITNRDNIDWNSGSFCVFNPDAEVRFERNGRVANVQLCFTCNDLLVVRDDEPTSKNRLHFKSGRPALLSLLRDLYSKDDPIWKLPLEGL